MKLAKGGDASSKGGNLDFFPTAKYSRSIAGAYRRQQQQQQLIADRMPTVKKSAGLQRQQLQSIPGVVAGSLDNVQRSGATQRKNLAILHRTMQSAATIVDVDHSDGNAVKLTGEKAFVEAWKLHAVNVALTAKRGLIQGDRAAKFIAAFVAYALQQAEPESQSESRVAPHPMVNIAQFKAEATRSTAGKQDGSGAGDAANPSTASRLASHTLRHILKAFTAADKTVRFRAVQAIAILLTAFGELECVNSHTV
jgi:condensin complex subunit 3